MAFGKWKAVIEELREQRAESERAWAEHRAESERARAEHRAEQQVRHAEISEFLDRNEREWKLARREHQLARRQMESNEQQAARQAELSRRAYEEGMAVCTQLVERQGELIDAVVQALAGMREDIRAQTSAVFKLIDRIDGLDGGTAAA